MVERKKKTIAAKVFTILVSSLFLVTLVACGIIFYLEKSRLVAQLKQDAKQIADRTANSLVGPAWYLIEEDIRKVIDLEVVNDNILAIVFTSKDKVYARAKDQKWQVVSYLPSAEIPISTIRHYSFHTEHRKILYTTLSGKKQHLGDLHIYFSEYFMKKQLKSLILKIIVQYSSLGVIILCILFYSLRRWIISPIILLDRVVKQFSEVDFSVKAVIRRDDELGRLAQAFNDMADQLQNSFQRIEAQNKEIKGYSEQLQDMVAERTSELNRAIRELADTFQEVNELKIRQDGDYFLTSQIVNPLMSNTCESEFLKVSFYISQHKKFSFQDWNSELGGDICIAHSIFLYPGGKKYKYTVFVNADAMGKSIQGAGGALVLGVMFNTFVSRVKASPLEQHTTAEDWLLKCYEELQTVFVSFQGSMYISALLGIVEDASGTMHFLNCEHPRIVLYRDGKAVFVEDEVLIHKIGTKAPQSQDIQLQSLVLQDQDAIFIGSDGKDDIVLFAKEGEMDEVPNSEEDLFLTLVEQAGGDLPVIIEKIGTTGQITDDISLIKIAYNVSKNESIL
ncbi:MAG: SpoIIE family protein phosphatase [Spirochaetota bacterium]